MKNQTKNIAASLIISAFFFVPVFCSAQVSGGSDTFVNPVPVQPGEDTNDAIVAGNVYTVLGTYEQNGITYVILRNPWGTAEPDEEEESSRSLQLISNVMKASQDTQKNVIRNIR